MEEYLEQSFPKDSRKFNNFTSLWGRESYEDSNPTVSDELFPRKLWADLKVLGRLRLGCGSGIFPGHCDCRVA